MLVKLEQQAEASETIIKNALQKASVVCSIDELADRVDKNIVEIPKEALDYKELLEAELLRDHLEVILVRLQILPPEDALLDGVVHDPWTRDEKPSKADKRGITGNTLSSSSEKADMGELPELRAPSEAELKKRKQHFEASAKIENVLKGYDAALLEVGRVHKVVKGGTTMSMRALVVIGNRKGVAGYGEGRSDNVQSAVERACREAKRNLLCVPLNKNGTIYHRIRGRFVKSEVAIWPAPRGTGIMANNHFAAVFQLFGIHDIGAKLHGPRCLNNATKALFNALSRVTAPQEVAEARGLADLPYPMRDGSLGKQRHKKRAI